MFVFRAAPSINYQKPGTPRNLPGCYNNNNVQSIWEALP
jgi:hypothetical protein